MAGRGRKPKREKDPMHQPMRGFGMPTPPAPTEMETQTFKLDQEEFTSDAVLKPDIRQDIGHLFQEHQNLNQLKKQNIVNARDFFKNPNGRELLKSSEHDINV